MPIATPEVYADMLDRAKAGSFAYPAINVSSSQTLNAALKGFADAGSDGIVQVSTGGAEYLSGPSVKNMVSGSLAFAAYAAEVAKNYPVNIALHPDHCPKDKLDGFVRPLLAASAERVASKGPGGGLPYFQSHMWDGSAVPLDENLEIARELLALAKAANVVLEIEVGVVGGEEDGVAPSTRSSTPPPRTPSRRSRRSARVRTAATSPPSPSATSTASTSRATSSSAPRSSSRRSRPRPRSSAWPTTPARSTSSSMAGPARCPRRSLRRSTTASSR